MNPNDFSSRTVKITYIQEGNKTNIRPTTASANSIHSVRKPVAKPWKKEVTPPKVYIVHSKNFRKVVQRLTGAPPESESSKRLQSMAPPPLEMAAPLPPPSSASISDESSGLSSTSPPLSFWTKIYNNLSLINDAPAPAAEPVLMNFVGSSGVPSPFSGLCLSPSPYYAWHSFPFLSPGTLASLGEGTAP